VTLSGAKRHDLEESSEACARSAIASRPIDVNADRLLTTSGDTTRRRSHGRFDKAFFDRDAVRQPRCNVLANYGEHVFRPRTPAACAAVDEYATSRSPFASERVTRVRESNVDVVFLRSRLTTLQRDSRLDSTTSL